MLETADLPAALGRIRRVTGLPVAFGGVVGADGRHLRLSDFAGTATLALHGLVVSAGNGLGGRVVATARPSRVEDYAADPRITHVYDAPVTAEGLRAIAAVPVVMGGTVLAVLYAGTRERLAVGVRAVDAMGRVALRVGTEITVRREVARRMAELETAAARTAPESTAREWEEVRLAHADLRTLAAETTDAALKARLQGIADRLTPCAGPARRSGNSTAGSPGTCRGDATPTMASLGWRGPGPDPAAPANPLSPRELDVLAMVAVGCGNAEAARRLGLLPETVKSYLRNAMRKLGTHGRMETIVTARRLGFLP